jgi:acyl-CoA thioesterase FadM
MRKRLVPVLEARGEELSLVVAESTVEYLAPIFYPERVVVRLVVAAVGDSSFTLDYDVVKMPPADEGKADGDDEEEMATACGRGRVRLVCVDPQTQRKASLSPLLRRLLEADAEKGRAGRDTVVAAAASQTTASTKTRRAEPGDDLEAWPVCWVHEVEYRDLDVNVHANNIAVYCTHAPTRTRARETDANSMAMVIRR